MNVKIKRLHPDAILPKYAHGPECDAGMDLYAVESAVIMPDEWRLAKTGIAIELEPGFEAQIRSRSGLALKHGIAVLNAPATIDPSYRGDVGVILVNHGEERFVVSPGDRIAQLVIAKYEPIEWEEQENLSESARAERGFGSTGR